MKNCLNASIKNFLRSSLTLATIVIFSLSTTNAGPDDNDDFKRAPTLDEIRFSVIRHKKSVVEFGLFTINFFPEYFPTLFALPPSVRWPLIKAYLELHDNPKLWSLVDTQSSPHPSEKMPLESMRDNWHRDIPANERGWIDELNSREAVYKSNELMKILSRHGVKLSHQLMDELFNLEDIADVMDTKLFRWKEMGYKSAPPEFAAEAYFRDRRKREIMAQIARKVEINWRAEGNSCLRLF